jgi:hypothetical protein
MLPDLETEFGLDLTKWRQTLEAKIYEAEAKSSLPESDGAQPARYATELPAK